MLFSNKIDFVTNNSNKITSMYTLCLEKIHIKFKTGLWIFMSDWKPNVSAPIIDIKRLNPLNFKQEEWG